MQRTLGPRDLAMVKEQEPLFMLSNVASTEPSNTHQESLHRNLYTNNLTLNHCENLPVLSIALYLGWLLVRKQCIILLY